VEEHWTVGRVAELAGVTVRTLHHYDGIGLVPPSARTAAGYRAYSAGHVERLGPPPARVLSGAARAFRRAVFGTVFFAMPGCRGTPLTSVSVATPNV
jgi:hypothetical protein